ncbi:MAG: fimbria major subunit [Muribaculaceae bacterium]|nr:fimbria major subunit [Muribaculaceae bacterium]
MNWFKHIFTISLLLPLLLSLQSCVADTLTPDSPLPDNQVGTPKGRNSFAAFHVAVDYSHTRSEEQNGIFIDDGTAEERVLYLDFPEDEVHHVILFFDENGEKIEITDPETEISSYVVPLTLTPKVEDNNSNTGTDSDSDTDNDNSNENDNNNDNDNDTEIEDEYIGSTYTYLFAKMPNDIVSKILAGKVLTVVNASSALVERLKGMTNGNTEESVSNDYERILSFLQSTDNVSDFFLTTENERYFTMTSSMVIREQKVVSAADNQLKFWSTPELAEKYPYTLYVERLLSKYTVEFKDPSTGNYFFLSNKIKSNGSADPADYNDPEEIEDLIPTDDEPEFRDKLIITPEADKLKYVTYYTRRQTIDEEKSLGILKGNWKVNIVGWGINNLEQKQYLFKKINNINYYDNWSSSNRTFWGEDPHYSTGYYPDQYRSVLKLNENQLVYDSSIIDYESMEKGNLPSNPLECLSFDDLVKKDLIVYTPENTFEVSDFTMGENPFKTQKYLRMNTHLIVGAQLLIEGFDNNVYNSNDIDSNGLIVSRNQEVQTKFYMNDIYWAEDAYKEYVAEYLGYYMLEQSNKDLFGENDGYIYINKEGGKADSHHFYLAPAHIKGGDGWVYLCPSPEYKFYVRNPNYVPPVEVSESESSSEGEEENPVEPGDSEEEEPEEEEEYFEISRELLQVLAYQHPELMAKRFDKGRMYYVAATDHNPNIAGLATGRFGSVRNNWYNFKVETIKNVGTPVAVPSQPIVPNNEPLTNAIGISLRILGWHGEYEDVDISGQHPGGVPPEEDPGEDDGNKDDQKG